MNILHEYVFDESDVYSSYSDVPWYFIRNEVKKVYFDESFKLARCLSIAYWFYDFENCSSFNLSNLNTSNVHQMQQTFSRCKSVTYLDLSGFDTSNVERIANMFNENSSLEELNISGWNTENVLYMAAVFYECSSLKTIYADRDFEISSNLQNDTNVFYGCTSLVGGNGTKFDSSKVNSEMTKIDRDGVEGYFTEK